MTALVVAALATITVAVSSAAAPRSRAGGAAPVGSLAGAPTGVTATAGVDSASISFTPATSTPAVKSYTVTAYPGGEQGFGATAIPIKKSELGQQLTLGRLRSLVGRQATWGVAFGYRKAWAVA
jgi:hypothetical protein